MAGGVKKTAYHGRYFTRYRYTWTDKLGTRHVSSNDPAIDQAILRLLAILLMLGVIIIALIIGVIVWVVLVLVAAVAVFFDAAIYLASFGRLRTKGRRAALRWAGASFRAWSPFFGRGANQQTRTVAKANTVPIPAPTAPPASQPADPGEDLSGYVWATKLAEVANQMLEKEGFLFDATDEPLSPWMVFSYMGSGEIPSKIVMVDGKEKRLIPIDAAAEWIDNYVKGRLSEQGRHLDANKELKKVNPHPSGVTFWTYTNWVHKYAKVHRGSCAHCNDGRGSHGAANSNAGEWVGPFNHVGEALQAGDATGWEVTICSFCAPG